MKQRTIKILGRTIVIALAAEVAPHFNLIEPCVAETISFCAASDRILDRTLDHTPENENDTFGGENSGWIASGQINSMTPSSSTNPIRFIPAGEFYFVR